MKKKYIEVFIKSRSHNNYKTGVLKLVPRGYARNYLIPYDFAEIPSKKKKKYLQKINARQIHEQQEFLLKQQKLKQNLETIKKFSLKKKSNETCTFFGSVTEKDILATIYKNTGIKLSKNTVAGNSFKQIGIYNILINLGDNIKASIELQILPDIK